MALLIVSNTHGQESNWEIESTNIDPSNYYGITVANGMIGLVSSAEPMKVDAVVLNGAYDLYSRGRVSNILKGFNFVNMELDIDGKRVNSSDISNFRQKLNMKSAILETSFEVNGKAKIKYKLMALRHLPFSAMIDFHVEALADIDITPINKIESPQHLRDVRNTFSVIDRPHVQIPLMTSVAKSPTGKHDIAASISYIIPDEHHFAGEIIHEDWDYNMHLIKFNKALKKGEKFEFQVVGSVISTAHVPDALNEAERLTIYATLEGKERLLKRHLADWEDLWKSDIQLEGDPLVQKDIRSALYHLYSFAREGTAYSLSPMGLSGLGYNGHIFWDTELWMYPPLLMLQPEIARSLLEYRWKMLPEAKRNAFSHGYKGAMFPWESADTGQEATPVWALTGPFQHHITGCVGWSFWKYYEVTKDEQWLKDRGYPMLKEVADFWASRVERTAPGNYGIKNVIGANEYEENIDNNAFTNGMAKTVLRYAADAARILNIQPNPDWEHVADNIPILKFPDGTTKENATYNGSIIKQADVNLLSFPLDVIRDEKQILKDLNYYESKMDPNGPAMGNSVLSALYARTGNLKKSLNWFVKSYEPNKVPPFGVLSETAGGTNPYFATGAGGMLQAVLSGYGGLEISKDGIIQIDSKLPKGWTKLTITGVGVENKTFTVK